MNLVLILITISLILNMASAAATSRISFFEEFPEQINHAQLKQITSNARLYLAARNISEFRHYEQSFKAKNRHLKEIIYWPVLSRKEGYWISPFSKREALERTFKELEGTKTLVMLDLELPTTRNPWLYLTEFRHFPGNKQLISDFIHNYSGEIYTAEYFPQGTWGDKKLQALGLHYPYPKIKIIKMLYHSLHPSFSNQYIKKQLQRGQEQWGNNFIIGYGTIATGISGTENILSPELLEKDLQIAKETGVQEVVIFRLGGLNKEYGKSIKKFTKDIS